jgi:H+/gluconate symporter-like permease
MFYELMGRGHAAALRRFAAREAGQGTVEYVGLVLLVGVLLAGIVKASGGFKDNSIANAVIAKLKDAIDGVGGSAPGPAPRG